MLSMFTSLKYSHQWFNVIVSPNLVSAFCFIFNGLCNGKRHLWKQLVICNKRIVKDEDVSNNNMAL